MMSVAACCFVSSLEDLGPLRDRRVCVCVCVRVWMFCVFHPIPLQYRKSHDPSGFLELRDVKRVEVGVSGKGSRQGIRLNIHLHSRKRVFELLAGTDKECNQWAEMIEMCRGE